MSEAKDADVDRLTREEIEDERDAAQTLLDESPTAPSFVLDRLRFKIRLCDLALSVLSQEAKPFAIDEHITRLKARIAELEKDAERLRALMKGLEVQEIDTAIGLNPATLQVLGMRIARAAKLGAHLVPPDEVLKLRA